MNIRQEVGRSLAKQSCLDIIASGGFDRRSVGIICLAYRGGHPLSVDADLAEFFILAYMCEKLGSFLRRSP